MSKTAPFGPETFSWSYSEEEDFLSDRISGAQRLGGGNTLVCSGSQGWVFEVTPSGDRVWEFRLADLNAGGRTGGGLFRAPYYPATFPAFRDRNLVALD